MKYKSTQDEMRALGYIKCAIILHNLFISTWKDIISEARVQMMVEDARKGRDRERDRRNGYMMGESQDIPPNYRRRDEVAWEMLRMEEDPPDMDTFELWYVHLHIYMDPHICSALAKLSSIPMSGFFSLMSLANSLISRFLSMSFTSVAMANLPDLYALASSH